MKQLLKRRILPWSLSLMLMAIFTLGLPKVAHAQSTQQANPTPSAAISARDAFREAYPNRYTWDERFRGYSAEVSVNYQGELDQGIIRVSIRFNDIQLL